MDIIPSYAKVLRQYQNIYGKPCNFFIRITLSFFLKVGITGGWGEIEPKFKKASILPKNYSWFACDVIIF